VSRARDRRGCGAAVNASNAAAKSGCQRDGAGRFGIDPVTTTAPPCNVASRARQPRAAAANASSSRAMSGPAGW